MTVNEEALKSISDKQTNHGHRAHYLGSADCQFSYSTEDLRRLMIDLSLDSTDQAYINEILESLENVGQLPFKWTPQEQFFVEHNNQDRVIPYLLYRFKFRILPERRVVTKFPVHLLIEPMSVCNLRCVMCFQTDKTFTKKPFMGMMDIDLYRNIIDQAVEGGAGAVSLGSRGEPFLHPGMGEMMKYASEKNSFFDIKINTNATKLSEAQCHEILSSDVNLIALSIDAYEEKMYEEIRVRGKFKEVLNNVKRLRKIRDTQYPQSKAEIRVSGVRFRDDQDEAGFHDFWSEICDTVVYVRAQLRWNTYENAVHPERTRPCDFLWNKLYVWHDGICNPCDEDYKSNLTPGNATHQSIEKIWNGETLNKMREKHLAGRRSDYNPCDRCGV